MPQAEIRNYGFFATALGALLLFVATAAPALAVDADWLSNPGSGDWNTNGNWNPPTAPVNAGDTATFHISMITSLSLSGAVTINTMTFNSGANAFTIDTNGNSFSFVGTGIVNNSTQTQFIENGFGIVNFSNSSTAGNARINNDNGGVTNFLNSSTAGNATITNTNIGSGSGVTNFSNTSTAGNALIENDAGGTTNFSNNSTAGAATVTNDSGSTTNFSNSSTAGTATVTNDFGGKLSFSDNSSADHATIMNANSGSGAGTTEFHNFSTADHATITNSGVGGVTQFGDNSNAANATITNTNGGTTSFLTNSNAANATITNNGGFGGAALIPAGKTMFQGNSTAGNATLIANGGSGISGSGGAILFGDGSTGDTTRVEVFAAGGGFRNGSLDISLHSAPGVTIGSIEGDGDVFLGANNLTVGSNNLSTLFSGVIQDGGEFGGTGGSLTKVGTGTLTLTGVNTYTGITTINAGVLSISRDANLGIAPGAPVANQLTLNGGTLQGTATFNLATNRGITLLAGGGTIEVTGANTLSYAGSISGTGNLTKVGTGTQSLGGENFYTGTTFVNEGTLTLVSGVNTRQHIIIGPLIIGDNVGAPNTATVMDGIISDLEPKMGVTPPVPVTVNSDGLFVVNVGSPLLGQGEGVGQLVINRGNVRVEGSLLPGFLDPVGQHLEMNGGSISGAGSIVLPDVTATSDASGNAATISAKVKLPQIPDVSRVLTVNDGPGSTDLLISGVIFQEPLINGNVPVGITKEGAGTLVLTGANTYLGITTINDGVLSISSDANLGIASSPAPVPDQLTFNGGTLQATASFDLDTNRGITLLGGGTIGVTAANILRYGGVITGPGSLTKIDTGTLLLSGINTYTGATAVNGGTLRAGVTNTLPSQTALTMASGATFDLNNFGQSIGSLAGAGSVTLGTGTLTTGNNNTSTNFSGTISGNGSLTKVGTGTLTLTGANTYTGGTTINDGALQLGKGGTTGSIVGDVVNNGILAINRSDTYTFGGVISGTGAFQQNGPGTVVFTAANTSAGTTVVNDGSLFVDKSISSAQTLVNAGGLLGGNGIIGGDLTNNGIVSPGNSPGTLTVNGNYTQTANGTLRIEIAGTAPGQFDLLAVGGHASLAGTLQLKRLGNFQLQIGDKITFLTAQGGVSGTFSPIENPFLSGTLIKVEINILANAVQLEGTQGSFTSVACNPNTLAVANALDSAVGDPRMAGVIEFLDTQPLSKLCGDLELIAPDELPAMFNVGVSLANIQSVSLERRMEDIRAGSTGFSARGFSIDSRVPELSPGLAGPTGPEGKSGPSVMQPTPENRWGVFVTGLGEFTDVDSTSIVPGYNFSTGGLTFGVDYRVSPNFAIGLTGGYAHTNADLVNNGSLDVNGGTIGAYATGFAGGFYVNAAAFGVFNGYDSHRTALLGTASGNTDGQDFNALAMAGYDWKSGGLTIGPLASFQYTYVGLDSFTEHGSLAPLSFSNQNAESTRTALGAKASYDWHVGHVVVKPEIRASWQHEFGDTDYSIVSRFASGAGNSFTVNGPAIGRDSLLIGAGAAVLLNDRVSVYAYYDGELARTNYSSNNVSAGLRFTF